MNIFNETADVRGGNFDIEELIYGLKKFKRNKSPGPDGIPAEIFKDMDECNLEIVLEIIQSWWKNEYSHMLGLL